MEEQKMLTEKTWEEFKSSGMLFFVNFLLQIFGWSIVLECEETGEVIRAYPARTKFRGFSEDIMVKSFENIATYMRDNADTLYKETLPEPEE